VDQLNRPTVYHGEGRPQYFVAADDLAKTALERGDVERACETQRCGKVIRDARRIQLLNEPRALLRERNGQITFAHDRLQRRELRAAVSALFDDRCQLRDRGRTEKVPHCKFGSKGRAHARDDLSRK
jgi:hypothetical protein